MSEDYHFKFVPNERDSLSPDRPAFGFRRETLEKLIADNPKDEIWFVVNEMEGGGWIASLVPESKLKIDRSLITKSA